MESEFMLRVLAVCLGVFSIFNLLAGFVWPGFGMNHWWIDLRVLPAPAANMIILCSSLALCTFGVRPAIGGRWRRVMACSMVMLLAVAVWNCAVFYALLWKGIIYNPVPLPLSALIAIFLGLIVKSLLKPASEDRRPGVWRIAISIALFVLCLPLAQMFFFGKTDYRRTADVAIVFGARAYADGCPSHALADRVRTACELHRGGFVKQLLFSGGPGDGQVHETECMRQMALSLGVPDDAIVKDESGLNTRATVENANAVLRRLGAGRVIVVSHAYHLPRVKMAFQRDGRNVYTVPAHEQYMLTKMPLLMAREVAAIWVYYLDPR